jgi:hypothetical protein
MNLKKLGIVLFLLIAVVGFTCNSANAATVTCKANDWSCNLHFLHIGHYHPEYESDENKYIFDIYNGVFDVTNYFHSPETKSFDLPDKYIGENIYIYIYIGNAVGPFWEDYFAINNWDGTDINMETHYILGWKDYRTSFTYDGKTYESGSTDTVTYQIADDNPFKDKYTLMPGDSAYGYFDQEIVSSKLNMCDGRITTKGKFFRIRIANNFQFYSWDGGQKHRDVDVPFTLKDGTVKTTTLHVVDRY